MLVGSPFLSLVRSSPFSFKTFIPTYFLQGFGGRAVSMAVPAHRGCPPAPSPYSTLLPPGHLCRFGLAASSSQENHDEKALKKNKGRKHPDLPHVADLCCLDRGLRFGGCWELTCTRATGRGTPGMVCLVSLRGLTVVTPADRQLGNKGGGISVRELRKFPRCLLQLSLCLCTGGGYPASLPHAWSQKVRGRWVTETLFYACGG